jgi:hypothetical protein
LAGANKRNSPKFKKRQVQVQARLKREAAQKKNRNARFGP